MQILSFQNRKVKDDTHTKDILAPLLHLSSTHQGAMSDTESIPPSEQEAKKSGHIDSLE